MELSYPELALHPRSLAGVRYPHPSLEGTYQPGVTEGWIAQLASAFLVASGGSAVFESGGFQGVTSAWLALTLERMGGGELIVAEIDQERAMGIHDRLGNLGLKETDVSIRNADALNVIAALPNDCLDLAWIDDDHQKHHVDEEIQAIWPKMRSGGIILFHDVFGSVDLQEVVRKYQGYAIDLPRLGPAGGIGVLQVR